jgi:hypothetical protein
VLLVPGRRQRQVAAGHLLAEPGLQPELHVAGAEPAAEDGRHPQRAERQEDPGNQRELAGVGLAGGERGHHDIADHPADHI